MAVDKKCERFTYQSRDCAPSTANWPCDVVLPANTSDAANTSL